MTRSPMTCDAVLPMLDAYLEEWLDPQTSESIQQHTDECESCGTILREQIDAELNGPSFASEQRLIGAAVDATRPRTTQRTHLRRTIWAVASVAAAALIVFSVFTPDTNEAPTQKEKILAQLRRGPLDVTTASYHLEDRTSTQHGIESTGKLIVDGPRLTLQKNHPDGGLINAAGFDGTWRWSFDAEEDRLKVSRGDGGSGGGPSSSGVEAVLTDDSGTGHKDLHTASVDANVAPGVLTGRALADYLSNNYDLDYAGEQDIDGHPCWILVGSNRAQDDPTDSARLRCYVDAARRVMRKWIEETPTGTRTATLTQISLDDAAPFGPAAFVSPSTRLDLSSAAFPLEGIPLEALAAEIQSSFGMIQMGVAIRIDAGVLDPALHPGAGMKLAADGDLPPEIRSLLSFLGNSDEVSGIFAGKDRKIFVSGARTAHGELDLPVEFSKMVDPDALREASDLDGVLKVLSDATGVRIELRGFDELDVSRPRATVFQFHTPIPMPAHMILMTTLDAHRLTVRQDGDVVIVEPAP